MAKTPAAAKPAPVTEEQLPAVQQTGGAVATTGDAMPDWAKEYQGPLGTENIDSQDVNIPRLKLGQSMTPEVKDKLVNDGDMFHSITKEVIIPLGSSGIVVPVAYFKEYILWRDRSDGGGIFARANRVVLPDGQVRYAWNKPNSTFTTKLKGVQKVEWRTRNFIDEDGLDQFGTSIANDPESGPAATAHFNYIFHLPDRGDMVAVSLSRSSARKAKDLNAMLKMGTAPMFMRCFRVSAIPDQNESGDKFYNYGIIPAGFVQDQKLFAHLQRTYMDLREKGITVDFSDEENGGAKAAAAAEQEHF